MWNTLHLSWPRMAHTTERSCLSNNTIMFCYHTRYPRNLLHSNLAFTGCIVIPIFVLTLKTTSESGFAASTRDRREIGAQFHYLQQTSVVSCSRHHRARILRSRSSDLAIGRESWLKLLDDCDSVSHAMIQQGRYWTANAHVPCATDWSPCRLQSTSQYISFLSSQGSISPTVSKLEICCCCHRPPPSLEDGGIAATSPCCPACISCC